MDSPTLNSSAEAPNSLQLSGLNPKNKMPINRVNKQWAKRNIMKITNKNSSNYMSPKDTIEYVMQITEKLGFTPLVGPETIHESGDDYEFEFVHEESDTYFKIFTTSNVAEVHRYCQLALHCSKRNIRMIVALNKVAPGEQNPDILADSVTRFFDAAGEYNLRKHMYILGFGILLGEYNEVAQ